MAEVSIFAVELLSEFPERSWTIYIENTRTGRKSQPFTLFDPFSKVDYEELGWYMEDYALQDPFAENRAKRATENLGRYATALISTLAPPVREVILQDGSTVQRHLESLHFLIFGDGTLKSLQSLLWELLERDTCWADVIYPAPIVTVLRVSETPSDVSMQHLVPVNPGFAPPLRILYLSSRPGLEEDISYRAISREIWDILGTGTNANMQPQIQFVRPGTWKRFKEILRNPGNDGCFDVVHFDMHGIIKKRSGKATLVLPQYLVHSSKSLTSRKCSSPFLECRICLNRPRSQNCQNSRQRARSM